MRNAKQNNRFFIGLLIVILVAVLLTRLFDCWLMPALSNGIAAAEPFLWGFALAYVLRYAIRPAEKLLLKITKSKHTAWARTVCTVSALLLTVGLIVLTSAILLPQVYNSVAALGNSLPGYLDDIAAIAEKTAKRFNIDISGDILQNLQQQAATLVQNNAGQLVNLAGNTALALGRGILNAFIAVIVAFYLLQDGGRYKVLLKRLMQRLIKDSEKCDNILRLSHQANDIMGRFITGKLLQVLIFTLLAFIGFWAVGVEYPLVMGLLTGMLNIIPYIGPWIAAVPILLLALLKSPATALGALAVILVLQILDNLFLGPKIMGDSLKTSPLWVFVGIIVGGAMFGIPGMLLGAPAVALINRQIQNYISFISDKKIITQ